MSIYLYNYLFHLMYCISLNYYIYFILVIYYLLFLLFIKSLHNKKDNVQLAILQFSECRLSLTFHWNSECIQMTITYFFVSGADADILL